MSCDLHILPAFSGGGTPAFLSRTPVVDRALTYASKCLRDAARADTGEPAIHHAIRVAELVGDLGSGADTIALALLHDVLEDGTGSVSRIRRSFGRSMAEGVVALTKPILGPRAFRRSYYHQVLFCSGEDVQTVKLADFLDNTRRRAGTPRGTRTFQNALGFVTGLRTRSESRRMLRRLDRVEALLLETAPLQTAA